MPCHPPPQTGGIIGRALIEAPRRRTEKMEMESISENEQKQLALRRIALKILPKILKFVLLGPKGIRAIMAIKGIPAQAFPNLKRTIH